MTLFVPSVRPSKRLQEGWQAPRPPAELGNGDGVGSESRTWLRGHPVPFAGLRSKPQA